jgi:hypothetical protein
VLASRQAALPPQLAARRPDRMPAPTNDPNTITEEERQDSARRARRLAILFAVIAVLAFGAHAILRNWLTGLENSIAAAQATLGQNLDENALRADIDRLQKQMTTAGGPGAAAGRNLDGATETMKRESRTTCDHLQGDFDGVSTLIDALPHKPDELLAQRDSTRATVQKAQADAQAQLASEPRFRGDSHPLAEAVSAGLTCTIRTFDVTPLERLATDTAENEKATIASLLRFSDRACYAAGGLALVLALYSAFKGLKAKPARG